MQFRFYATQAPIEPTTIPDDGERNMQVLKSLVVYFFCLCRSGMNKMIWHSLPLWHEANPIRLKFLQYSPEHANMLSRN